MAEGMRSGEGNTCILAPPRSAMAEGMRSGDGKLEVFGPTNKQLGDISDNI